MNRTTETSTGRRASGRSAARGHEGVRGGQAFRRTITRYYRKHGRSFPWRDTADPYAILVSEIMLQQTQTVRVLEKYGPFLARFPGFASLASSELRDVLGLWQGLGYNRRAVALRDLAGKVVDEHGGELPKDSAALTALPGIGSYTAGAVLAFAHQIPVAFVETNIRRVFIHFFFPDRDKVRDSEILTLVEATLDRNNPREWYYALMDYGAMLGRKGSNPNTRSAQYKKQAPLEGSDRQIRGRIIRELTASRDMSTEELLGRLGKDRLRVYRILGDLVREGFLAQSGDRVSIA